ncbi:MAG: outer membrane protein [Pseudolabrys sp.]
MISKFLRRGIATLVVAAAPLAANAADIPRYKAPAYVAPAHFSWTGFYVGVNVGYGFGDSDWTSPAISLSPSGFIGGLTGGYNFQTGTWVWGLEADLNWADLKDDTACGASTCTTKTTWLGTARGRIGYAGWDRWLPYLTGGAAFGSVKAERSLTGSESNTGFGWTLGAGLEYAVWSNWTVKAEYLYADLGKFDCNTPCGAVANEVSFQTHIVRAGLNYRF